MPGTRGSNVAFQSPDSPDNDSEPEKPLDSEEQIDFDGDNNQEETMEEEVEYEQVEEEEEEVEYEEVEEEEEEEELEEEEETKGTANGDKADRKLDGEEDIKIADTKDEDEKKKHAELLALPPHGSEVYLGGIPHNATEEDLRAICQTVGDVSEVRCKKFL